MKRLALTLALALGWLSGTAPAREPVDAKKLVGVWEVSKVNGKSAGDDAGSMLLYEDGTLSASPGGLKGAVLEGTYSLDGDQLTTRFRALGGGEVASVATVKRLTRDTLVLVEGQGQEVEYRRKRR